MILTRNKKKFIHALERGICLTIRDDVHGFSTISYNSLGLFLFFSVGVFKNGRVEIIPNDQGNRITPSYVAFTQEGERLIGDGAKNQLTSNPENTVFDAKRLIGREWSDSTVQSDIKYFPFKVVNKNNKPHIQLDVQGEKKTFAAEEISAMVLTKMKVSEKTDQYAAQTLFRLQ